MPRTYGSNIFQRKGGYTNNKKIRKVDVSLFQMFHFLPEASLCVRERE